MIDQPPFIRVELTTANKEKIILSQKHYDLDEIEIETTAKKLTVSRRDLQLVLLSISEEG